MADDLTIFNKVRILVGHPNQPTLETVADGPQGGPAADPGY